MGNKKIFILLFIVSFSAGAYYWDRLWQSTIVNNAPEFTAIKDTKLLKKTFFEYLTPIIMEQNQKILQLRNKIKNGKINKELLTRLAKKYRTTPQNILHAIDIIPPSLVLAQAAVESSWGRSRFAKFNNYYGIWCFVKGCGVVPNKRDSDAKHEVATFHTIQKATREYIFNLNSHQAYAKLRNIRKSLRQQNLKISGVELAFGLEKYSGIGNNYVKILQKMIIYNKLDKLD